MSNSNCADLQRHPCRVWSLSWQAAVGREFFGPASLAERIRHRLIDAHQRSGRVLLDFVLLPTEIHALAQIGADDCVAGVARSFGNVVSRWVREEQPIRSPVLAGPYRAQLIESEAALRLEVRMLAWRPVQLKCCSTATHYSYSGLRPALGLASCRGFNARPLLNHFGDSVPAARIALRKAIDRRPCAQDWREWELSRGLELATGSVGPRPCMARTVGGAAAVLIAAGGGYGVDAALELLQLWVGAKLKPAAPIDLSTASSALAARGRALVACMAVAHRLCSGAAVARHFCRSKSTLSEQMASCRSRPVDRSIIATPLRRVVEEAASLKRVGQGTMHHGARTARRADDQILAAHRGTS